ncbi:MAG: hypothetical protein AB3N21_06360 [Ruegeria sp.]|uniref:hypothetical protein n=1 Tax=Ruegeria sp. TaxID=1879320 RepID=UPI00349EEB00
MSDTVEAQNRQAIRPDLLVIGLVIVLSVALFWYLAGQRQYTLRNSAAGFDGLSAWLTDQGHSARSFTGGWPLESDTIGLLVQPVFDARLDSPRLPAQTKEELLLQPDEFDQEKKVILEKAKAVQSLIILPKWRSGLRLSGLGHPVLLVPRSDVQDILHSLVGADAGAIRYWPKPFAELEFKDGATEQAARIYAAQLFEGQNCEPILGTKGAMLLGSCPLLTAGDQRRVYVLSDPDLLNNHGLRLGDNARIANRFLTELAGDKRMVIDYSASNWLTKPEEIVKRERTWEDLARVFDYPFRVLWFGAAALLVLAIWRGGIRAGPVLDIERVSGAGKRSANRARARLMRMTDQDGALLSDYVDTRIQARAAAVFGPAFSAPDGLEPAFLRYVRARDPALAARLEAALGSIRALPPQISATEAITHADRFELILEQVAHDA